VYVFVRAYCPITLCQDQKLGRRKVCSKIVDRVEEHANFFNTWLPVIKVGFSI
jgi:hypothetical protein